MPTTFSLRVWTRFLAPVEDVWKLKCDLKEISSEFGPWMRFCISDMDRIENVGEDKGELGFRGIPFGISWPLHLEQVEPQQRFIDRSSNLLYRDFRHEHLFEPTPDGCRYIDAVTFNLSLNSNAQSNALSGTVTVYSTNTYVLGSSTTFTTPRLINLSKQVQLTFRVITRDTDSATKIRPNNA